MNGLTKWIRRRRVAWLREKARELEDSAFGTLGLRYAMLEADRMRAKAKRLEAEL